MNDADSPLDLARHWVTIHPVDEQVSILRWIEDAKELDDDLLEAMIRLLVEGSEEERDVAGTVLRFRGYQVLAGGGSPGSSSYQVTEPGGTVHTVDASTYAPPEASPVDHRRKGRRRSGIGRRRDN